MNFCWKHVVTGLRLAADLIRRKKGSVSKMAEMRVQTAHLKKCFVMNTFRPLKNTRLSIWL